jgi:hypothetical protein
MTLSPQWLSSTGGGGEATSEVISESTYRWTIDRKGEGSSHSLCRSGIIWITCMMLMPSHSNEISTSGAVMGRPEWRKNQKAFLPMQPLLRGITSSKQVCTFQRIGNSHILKILVVDQFGNEGIRFVIQLVQLFKANKYLIIQLTSFI